MGAALLKFLSGAQNGAEAALEQGEYVLGSGDEADLFLSDAAVRERHALLSIRGQEWLIEPLDSAEVRVAGRLIAGAVALAPYSVLTLGGVHLAIGPDGAWPSLPAIPDPVSETTAPEPAETPAADAPNEPDAPAAPDSVNAAAAPEPARDAPAKAPEQTAAQRRWAKWLLFLLFLALLAAALVVSGEWRRIPGLSSWLEPSLAERTAETLRLRGLPVEYPASGATPPGVVAVGEQAGGGAALSGLVMTEGDRDSILAAAGSDASLGANIKTVDGELEAANAALRSLYSLAFLAKGDAPFTVRLSGLVMRDADSGAAYRLARDALDSRIALRRNLVVWAAVREEAERMLRDMDLPGARFVMEGDRAALESPAWPDRETRRELLRRLEDRFGELGNGMFAETLNRDFPEGGEEPPPPPARTVQLQPLPYDITVSVLSGGDAPPLPELPVTAEPPRAETPVQPADPEESGAESGAAEPPPEAPPPPPPPVQWQVLSVARQGFVDQHGEQHRVGELLGETLRIVGVWPDGVVLQQGERTLFVPKNNMIIEK